ncbi:MAG: hypothetical protein EBW46_13480 [Rhodobacterales bacterium]|nr:hypothetical protein [Rhodobacterales bacterium]
MAWSVGIPPSWISLPDIRDNRLDYSKYTNRFSEQIYFNQEKEFLIASFCVPFSQIKTASYCFNDVF